MKCCWFHLLITLVGMSVVDIYHVYLNHDKEKYKKMTVLNFSEEMCLDLQVWNNRNITLQNAMQTSDEEIRLAWIVDSDGNMNRPPSDTQQTKHNWMKGSAIMANCFMCQKYIMEKNTTNYVKTTFCCLDCRMPLCLADWHSEKREMMCYQEHKSSTDTDIGCYTNCVRNRSFPKAKQVFIGDDWGVFLVLMLLTKLVVCETIIHCLLLPLHGFHAF